MHYRVHRFYRKLTTKDTKNTKNKSKSNLKYFVPINRQERQVDYGEIETLLPPLGFATMEPADLKNQKAMVKISFFLILIFLGVLGVLAVR